MSSTTTSPRRANGGRRVQGFPAWIEVAGFKSIREPARIDLRPLTLLAGANSSGKSSILQPVLLLKQSLAVPYDPDPLLLAGPHLTVTSLDQILSRGRARKTQGQQFHVTFGPLGRGLPHRPGESAGRSAEFEVKLTFSRKAKMRERLVSQISVRAHEDAAPWVPVDQDHAAQLLAFMGMTTEEAELRILGDGIQTTVRGWPKAPLATRLRQLPVNDAVEWTRSILHLPGFRGHRERRFPISKVTRSRWGSFSVVGHFPPYAASLLLEWRRSVSQVEDKTRTSSHERLRATENLQQVNDGMRQLGLTWKVLASPANAAELELRVGRMPGSQQGGANDLVDIADVGFGLSQVLPVLVALAAAVPGQLVLIEQPELHLHPRAQLAMGRVLADAAKRGVIVVVETHSQLILRAIQTVVAQGYLTPAQVGLNWFKRDGGSGWTTITPAELRKDGSFGDWPVDFPDVYAMADSEFIDAVFANGGPA